MPNPTVARGFVSSREVGSNAAFNGARSPYKLASGYGTTISDGDLVKLVAAGTIQRAAAGEQFRGIVNGFEYRDARNVPVFTNTWVGGTTTFQGLPATVFVVDDPDVEYRARFTGATVITGADVGFLFNISTTAGSAVTGMSAEGVDSTTGSATTGQLRFLGFVESPDNDTATANAVGRFAPVAHDFRVQTGI